MIVPGRLPLAGHLLRFGRDPVGFLQRLRDVGDVVAVDLGPRRLHVVNSPELIRRVLVTGARDFERGEVFAQARRVLGDGLATSDGSVHMRPTCDSGGWCNPPSTTTASRPASR